MNKTYKHVHEWKHKLLAKNQYDAAAMQQEAIVSIDKWPKGGKLPFE